jgi:hypothetical protein
MLEFVRGGGKASARKLRLLACAVARRLWPLLRGTRGRRAVEVAERYADGGASARDLWAARVAAQPARLRLGGGWSAPATAPAAVVGVDPGWAAASALRAAQVDAAHLGLGAPVAAAHCALVRCLFGPLPFRRAAADGAWLSWDGGAVVQLARAAYDGRHAQRGTLDNARLAVLADALLDAGCTNEELLGHLRSPGPHARGCWSVDVLLGRG